MGFTWSYVRNLASLAAGRKPSRPLLFSFYVTRRCPFACPHCSDGTGKPFRETLSAELSTDEASRLLGILRRASDTLDVTGGEPLLRPDLEEILGRARALGFRTILNTKGAGLEKRPEILRLSDVLVIGMDALEPAALALAMGGDVHAAEAVLSALRFAVAECRKSGKRLVLSAVASPGRIEDAGRVLAFAEENGIGFHLSPQIQGVAANPALRGDAAYLALVDRTLAAKRRGARVLGVEPYYRGIRDFSTFDCHPLLMPTIRPDGRLYYPCLEREQADVSLLEAGDYYVALAKSRELHGPLPSCAGCCHVFCHMALSLLQRHPVAALKEQRCWRA
ncbi:MAG: radical SAM protein [Planctomycetota bacterium]|mgnify:CR=1 FL=1